MNDFRIEFEPQLSLTSTLLAIFAAILVWSVARRLIGAPIGISQRIGLIMLRVTTFVLLMGLLLNPVKRNESTGEKHKPDAFYLLDSSQSMAIGDGGSRWTRALEIIHDSERVGTEPIANISLFRFGQRLSAVEPKLWREPHDEFIPTDADTQLAAALRQLTSRFGRKPPGAVVVFSDGRARDAADVGPLAAHYAKLKVPIHVVPVGEASKGGDLAIIGVVSPPKVRKNSQVEIRAFLRSYGFDEKRCELVVTSIDRTGVRRSLSRVPITVRSGIQSFTTSYQSGEQNQKIEVSVSTLPGEISLENNVFKFNVTVDRTKVRVLYVEGGTQTSFGFNVQSLNQIPRGPHSEIHAALTADPDIECVVLSPIPGNRKLQRISDGQGAGNGRGFPETIAELSAFDAIILSNVSRKYFTDDQLTWIEQWIEKRGGGICMLGGPNSFAAGGWRNEPIGSMLPIEFGQNAMEWDSATRVRANPATSTLEHPIWHLVENENVNREILRKIPEFAGIHRGHRAKTEASAVMLASADAEAMKLPMLTIGAFGKGRTLAMAVSSTSPWANEFAQTWGEGDNRYFARFWRNVIYWLTEDSSIGRRRLVVKSDQPFYRPNEKVLLNAEAYDESANRTGTYRLVGMFEPQGNLNDADPKWSPIKWPEGLSRTSGETGPFIAWGEEFDLPRVKGQLDYTLQLVLGPAPAAASATQSIRLELTAYEETTQVDSTSLDLRIVHDPFEQQNPFPDHEQLYQVAKASEGAVLRDARSIREMLEKLPVPPQTTIIRRSPWWSQPWILAIILGLITVEWFWRRRLGLG